MTDTEIEMAIKRYLLFKNKSPSEDNYKDILYNKNLLINYCKNFYFFSNKLSSEHNYNIDNLLSVILEQINFIYFRKDTNIWNIDDDAEDVYIIFKGEVYIYKTPSGKREKMNMQLDTVLGRGYMIGGECLKYNNINLENKRTYLAKTKVNCILGKMNNKDFFKIYKPILFDENNLLNTFMKEIKIFSSEFNGKFLKSSNLRYYKKNDYIFKQRDEFDTFYLVYSGSVRLFISSKKSVKSKIDFDLLKGNNLKERFTTSRQFELRGSYKELIKYNLLDASKGDFIGGIEYLNKFSSYQYSAICINDVTLLKVDLNLFNQNFVIKEEKLVFNEKIEKQKEFMEKRVVDIKLGSQKIKINDYILSKNKYMKAFLESYPLNQKIEEKLDSYINCNVQPIKIKCHNKNIKSLSNTKNLLTKYIEEYKFNKKPKKKIKRSKLIIKDFLTNIDYKKKYKIANIFPLILSEEEMPKDIPESHKVTFKIQEENTNDEKKIGTEPFREPERKKKVRSFSMRIFKRTFSPKKEKQIIFNNDHLKKHLFLDLKSKPIENEFKTKRNLFKFKSYRKNNK